MTTTGAIGRTLDNMATDHDIDSILSTSDTFCEAPEIPYSSPIEDITRAVAEYSKSGVPCVITGLPSTTTEVGHSAVLASAFFEIPQFAATCRPTPTGPRAPTMP